MKCKQVEKMLSSYLGNSLKVTYRDAIKEHLAECGKCMNCLNTMTKLDNLLKLKVKEKPSNEYWESYWSRLESKLTRTMPQQLSENGSSFNRFIPKFAFAFNGILIAVVIFLSGILYVHSQQIKLLQSVQEETERQICRYLFQLTTKVNAEPDAQMLDSSGKIKYNQKIKGGTSHDG